MKNKPYFIFLSGLLLGVFISFFASSAYYTKKIDATEEWLKLRYRAALASIASKAYYEDDTKTAIWIYEGFAKFFTNEKKVFKNDVPDLEKELFYAYIRLALLFKKVSNDIQFNNYITKAVELSEKIYAKQNYTGEDLIRIIEKYDSEQSMKINKDKDADIKPS